MNEDRLRQKEQIYSILKVCGKDFEGEMSVICKLTGVGERMEGYCSIFERLFRKYFGVYSSYTHAEDESGSMYRYFNGKYYESVCVDVIWYSVNKWMRDCGVPAKDRTTNRYVIYMKENMLSCIRDRQLRPRLSLMCFKNCVCDFRHPNRRFAHAPEFDVVKMYDFNYDPMAYRKCPIWKSFLGEPTGFMAANMDGVLPEKPKRRLLQMFLGSTIADRENISFEYFLILQGTGANGKSVIYRVLQDMFGRDEIINIKLSQFARNGDESLRAAYSLKGKRLMYCTESSRSDFRDISTLKAISSGEPIACRGIGGDIKTLQKPPVLMCNSNYRWKHTDFINRDDPDDDSITRRAMILNFEKTIPVEKRDTMLADRMKAEHDGIFSWIVKGYMELKRNGWRLPEDVGGNIDKKIEKNNTKVKVGDGVVLAGSVVEYLKLKQVSSVKKDEEYKKIRVKAKDLYDNYTAYCRKNCIEPATNQKFGRDLSSIGYSKMIVSSGGTSYIDYEIWCNDPFICDDFLGHVPSITDDIRDGIFLGSDYTDEEYDEFMKDAVIQPMD